MKKDNLFKAQRFSIRKLATGITSLAVGVAIIGTPLASVSVHADEMSNSQTTGFSVQYQYVAESELTAQEKELIVTSLPENTTNQDQSYYLVYRPVPQASTSTVLPKTNSLSSVAGVAVGSSLLVLGISVLKRGKAKKQVITSLMLLSSLAGASYATAVQAIEAGSLSHYNQVLQLKVGDSLPQGAEIPNYVYVGYIPVSTGQAQKGEDTVPSISDKVDDTTDSAVSVPSVPSNPSQPVQPVKPTQPVEVPNKDKGSITPTVPEVPTIPVTPTEPTQPVEPSTPVEQPTQPVEQPTTPTEPSNPVETAEPVQPEQPEQPSEPTQPVEPSTPVEQPTVPVEPTQPTQPVQPSTPAVNEALEAKRAEVLAYVNSLELTLPGMKEGYVHLVKFAITIDELASLAESAHNEAVREQNEKLVEALASAKQNALSQLADMNLKDDVARFTSDIQLAENVSAINAILTEAGKVSDTNNKADADAKALADYRTYALNLLESYNLKNDKNSFVSRVQLAGTQKEIKTILDEAKIKSDENDKSVGTPQPTEQERPKIPLPIYPYNYDNMTVDEYYEYAKKVLDSYYLTLSDLRIANIRINNAKEQKDKRHMAGQLEATKLMDLGSAEALAKEEDGILYIDKKHGYTVADFETSKVNRNLVNELRTQNGGKELWLSNELDIMAKGRAKELVQSFSHTRPNGEYYTTISVDMGFSDEPLGTSGENIAAFNANNEEDAATIAYYRWLNSPGHKRNMLNKNYTRIGFGLYNVKGTNVYYAVQLFEQ